MEAMWRRGRGVERARWGEGSGVRGSVAFNPGRRREATKLFP